MIGARGHRGLSAPARPSVGHPRGYSSEEEVRAVDYTAWGLDLRGELRHIIDQPEL